jgi:glycosyltransferase domain-containing protein
MKEKQKVNLDELTIVIITYKRYGFLKRLLSFFASSGLNFSLLVLDSTPNNPTEEDLLFLLESNPKLKWVRYDSSIFFANKIADGCKYINTKYSVMCADDDFLIPSGISKSIDFLKSNLEYSCCHGIYYNYVFQNSKKLVLNNIYGKSIGGEENTSFDRVVNYLNGTTSYYSFYAVHRTSDFRFIWESCKTYILDWGLSEIYPSSLSLILGKMKVLESPYSVREPNNFIWWDNEREEQMYSPEKIDLFVNGLVETFKDEKNEVGEVLKSIFKERLERSKLKKKAALNKMHVLNKTSIITKVKNKITYFYNRYYHQHGILLKKENCELIKALLLKNSDNINTARIDYSNQSNLG